MILLYHKVHPESKTCWWVNVEAFYLQMLALRGRKVVYLDDYDPADPNQVVISFDGVYRNILEHAAPLLKEFSYPFELFITSDYVGRDNAFDTEEPRAVFANETELAALIAMGGRLQWHSRTHVNLACTTDRECIRFELGVPENLRRLDPSGLRWFAYPYGEFNDIVVEEVRVRFVGGLSCIQGNDHDRFVLNRQIVTNDTIIKPRGRVAVIIASYNYGCYLPEAVESVLRQTRLPDEIHIVDDYSDDNTEEIGRYFADKRPGQIQFHRNVNNLGIVKNFSDAVSRTRSDYICVLGADNRMRSDYIERLAALLDIHSNVAIAYTDFALFGPRAGIRYSQFPSEQRGRVIRDYFFLITFPDFTPEARQQLEHGNFIHGSSMFRRTAYEQVGGYLREDGVPEDYHLFLRMVRAGWGAIRCPLPLLEYRQHSREQANIRLSTHVEAQFYRNVVAERDGQITSLNQTVAKRDGQIASLNQAIAERDGQIRLIVNSRSWKVTRPLRFASRLVHDGLTNNDRQRVTQKLRDYFRRLPLPAPAKRFAGFAYRTLRRTVFRTTRFCAPTIKPLARQEDLPDYVVWGVIPWHFRHQRPQQISMELARARRRVFYVSPNLVDEDRAGFQAEALDSSGLLFQVNLFAKGAPQIYSQAPTLPLVNQLRASIGEVLEWADCERSVSLVQHPFWCDVASVLPNRKLVYDCMDHHEGFGGMGEDLTRLEKRLFRESDLTVTTSAWLDQSVATHAQDRALIRNATDYEFFSQAPESTYRDPQGRRIIGYYGAIAEWLDLDLVEAVAQQHPECSVMMIGADTVNAKYRLAKLPNVTFIGEVPYRKLPHYLYGFDVCLLPFKVGPLTLATNPVKVYEYLSAGKPVVASDLPEMAQFDGLVYVAAKQKQFVETVGLLLATPESRDLIQRRKDFAQGQTWRHRAAALMQQAESSDREASVSVIVVTYDNIDLTRACLASIDAHSQYDNLEVIVVDNASSDGSREFLEKWASAGDSRKLILNDRNRGFAAANNQGLNVATGDFLVMLNNDTYVTPGWVRSLVNHLKRDKTIGLIGPVTNNIGNEAKIDIGYGDMSEMLAKSAAYTRRHIGRLYPLRTVAFFCVMMERETFARVGLLDEAFGRGWFEDDDYCRRIEQVGLRVVCAEDVFVHHHLSASFNKLKQQDRQELFEENKKIYEAKWGAWIPHGYRQNRQPAIADPIVPDMYGDWRYMSGCCNVCGKLSRFFYKEVELWRESLNCEHCHTTSRYRSIAQGILRAISELTGIKASALAMLPQVSTKKLHIYDTQPPFYYDGCTYPLPDLLKATGWIEVELSQYKPNKPIGEVLAGGVTNQNLECLTFSDESLDLVITSDVMEHVRLDALAHREIYRVLKPGGIYIFTVPHDRSLEQTMIRVQVNDPNDPKKDVHLLEPEYHGDANSEGSTGALSYRVYGRDLESYLSRLGFEIEYSRKDIANFGILNTELYYCRRKPARLIDDHDIGRGSGGQGRCVGAHASTNEPSTG